MLYTALPAQSLIKNLTLRCLVLKHLSTKYFWCLVVASVANNGRGSSGVSVSGVTNSGDGRGGNMGNGRGGNVSNGGLVSDGGAVDNVGLLSVDGSGDGLVDGGGVGLGDLLVGVGAGLVHKGLVDGLVGPDGSVDLLGAVGGDVLEDGLGNVGGLDNGKLTW